MAKFLATIKAIITRLVFASHGFIAIWQVTTFKKNPLFWYLSCPILLLFFEGIFTLTIKENQEWKWFCPSVFLYLSSVVPAIWLLELDKVDRRMKTFETNVNISENFDLTNLAAEDLKHLEKAFGVNINLPDIKISTETWVTLIEQFLMLILIIGRWMLPKGELTRDQLSQLLLVYIGTAADIIEFFDSFKEDRIAREPVLVYLTLGIWAWSLMQFTVVLTATKSRKSRLSSGNAVKKRAHTETSCCSIDVWGIALNMLLQDGPFLSFRLILIVHYRIVSYMNIFFTCKNTLVILLQLYRLYVVQTENRSKIKKKSEVSSISIISKEDMYKDVKSKRISEERRRKRRRDKDIEANYSDSEETTEEADKFDSSPRNIRHSRRKTRQDTGYSTSSSKNSGRHRKSQRGDSKKKPSREESTKIEISSDEDKRRKKIDKKSSVKRDSKLSESIKMKTRNEDSSKSSSKSRKCKEDSEEESTTEEVADKIVSQESESESERKRYVHRKRRQNRD
ncbi:transmembrane protein 26 [Bombus affinis]|uniref:transmembrane protein 26 n=1 Tax=Bombus affinis TaxID=309941 RepID=UPI0021B76F70|nr:transmembrane protein 26 [Bombus affinis]